MKLAHCYEHLYFLKDELKPKRVSGSYTIPRDA